jgi:dihydroxyacid dehydratase/phosphogluconate dehydratase
MKKPFIGVINTWSEFHPGHIHLRDLAALVKAGVRSEGGVPFEMNTIALCDGFPCGHEETNESFQAEISLPIPSNWLWRQTSSMPWS